MRWSPGALPASSHPENSASEQGESPWILPCIVRCPLHCCSAPSWLDSPEFVHVKMGRLPGLPVIAATWVTTGHWGEGTDAERCRQNWLLQPAFLLPALLLLFVMLTLNHLQTPEDPRFNSFVLISESYSLYLPLPASFLISLVCYFDQTQKFTDFLKASDPCQTFFF